MLASGLASLRPRTRWLGQGLQWRDEVASSNDWALAEAVAGAAHGSVYGAEHQTHGRGRQGRSWTCGRGKGLTFSLVLRWAGAFDELGRATLAVSAGLCQALREAGLGAAHIKWPNDLLVGSRKIAGVLSETRAAGGTASFVVVGVGLNVNQEQSELPQGATSWRVEMACEGKREELLEGMLQGIETAWETLEQRGFAEVARQWSALAPWALGRGVRVEHEGRPTLGVSAGIDERGGLRVVLAGGEVITVVAGGVEFS